MNVRMAMIQSVMLVFAVAALGAIVFFVWDRGVFSHIAAALILYLGFKSIRLCIGSFRLWGLVRRAKEKYGSGL